MSDLILVAVSGGSDSLSLLHRLADQHIIAATVDHGLRPEAKAEAEFVAAVCKELDVPHSILTWQPEGKSAEVARMARYELLTQHAQEQGASTIALGHTLDDQAETLVMRAFRSKPQSGTRGMSGMTEWATYDDIKLWRPLLNEKRQHLRAELRAKDIRWIDDPSNEGLSSERVRIRKVLEVRQDLPTVDQIGALASLGASTRQWLNTQTAKCIDEHAKLDGKIWHLNPECRNLPSTLLVDVFSTLILVSGGMPFRPSITKFDDLVSAFQSTVPLRKAVGRCLINVRKDGAHFSPESRNDQTSGQAPLSGLKKFRPAIDDAIYDAVVGKLN